MNVPRGIARNAHVRMNISVSRVASAAPSAPFAYAVWACGINSQLRTGLRTHAAPMIAIHTRSRPIAIKAQTRR